MQNWYPATRAPRTFLGHCGQGVSCGVTFDNYILGTYNFAHVENDNGAFETDTNTGDQATSDNQTKTVAGAGGHLEDNAAHVDETADDDGPFTANEVGDIAGDNSAKEGTAGENRDDQRLVGRGQSGGVGALDDMDEQLGAIDTVDVTRIVTKEDATEGSKGTDQVGFPGDWRLDAVNIVGGRERTHFAGHGDSAGLGM